jgi:hypothetical protein
MDRIKAMKNIVGIIFIKIITGIKHCTPYRYTGTGKQE